MTTTAIIFIAQASGQNPQAPGLMDMLMPIFLILMVFYFIMWRPQAKRHQEHQSFLNALKSGDDVVTAGGIVGTIRGLMDSL